MSGVYIELDKRYPRPYPAVFCTRCKVTIIAGRNGETNEPRAAQPAQSQARGPR